MQHTVSRERCNRLQSLPPVSRRAKGGTDGSRSPAAAFSAPPARRSTTICEAFPKAREFGFPDEMSAFGLQFAHGLGLALHERPVISRVVSLDHPTEIKEGMVFAIETYCPATDGYSAARIEEEVVVTDKGCRVISLFPAEELPIANAC
jgi:Xaa-Pro aminopeptidase